MNTTRPRPQTDPWADLRAMPSKKPGRPSTGYVARIPAALSKAADDARREQELAAQVEREAQTTGRPPWSAALDLVASPAPASAPPPPRATEDTPRPRVPDLVFMD